MNDKALTPEEILNKHLRTSDDIWEPSDLVNAMEEYSAQYNKAYNENLEKLIRERDRAQSRIAELEAFIAKEQNDSTNLFNALHIKERDYRLLSERLMGLLEEQFRNYHIQYIYEDYPLEEARTKTEADWKSFRQEHNLKIDTDGR